MPPEIPPYHKPDQFQIADLDNNLTNLNLNELTFACNESELYDPYAFFQDRKLSKIEQYQARGLFSKTKADFFKKNPHLMSKSNKCKCSNFLCGLANTRATQNLNEYLNLYENPITVNPAGENQLKFPTIKINQNDKVLVKMDHQSKSSNNFANIVRIEKFDHGEISLVNLDEEVLLSINERNEKLLFMKQSRKKIEEAIKLEFDKHYDKLSSKNYNLHDFKYDSEKNQTKQLSELYFGRPILVYYDSELQKPKNYLNRFDSFDNFSSLGSQKKYFRAILTHVSIRNLGVKINFYQGNRKSDVRKIEARMRTVNCLLVDYPKYFLENVPFQHIQDFFKLG